MVKIKQYLLSVLVFLVFAACQVLAEVPILEGPGQNKELAGSVERTNKSEAGFLQNNSGDSKEVRTKEDTITKFLDELQKERLSHRAEMAAERDPVRRISLDQEWRRKELSRKAKIFMEAWNTGDEKLTLNKALEEVKLIKKNIEDLQDQMDLNYALYLTDLKNAYLPQNVFKNVKLPSFPAPKDDFETMAEYQQRITVYEMQIKEATGAEKYENNKKEEAGNLLKAKENYLSQEITLLTPFIDRLHRLQTRHFNISKGIDLEVNLGAPDAENHRFPVVLRSGEKTWNVWWTYSDRNRARELYQTRTNLYAEAIFQIEEGAIPVPKLTAAKITHVGTGESREFVLDKPVIFKEIDYLDFLKYQESSLKEELGTIRKKEAHLSARKELSRDGHLTSYDDKTILDTKTNLMWAVGDNGEDINWTGAKIYCQHYSMGGYTDWRMPTQEELASLFDGSKSYKVDKRHYSVHLTSLIQLSASCLWTSEIRESEAAYYDFIHGKLFWTGNTYSRGYRALPVRVNK
ncbi:MAG TPA: DUF1566 domain-containing protein [Smithellaceae bacterium]|nr:DUF1566 domain-containing protein [Smithellaceae bacterium]HQM45037.1 DUF1566 domain-containing protein [Smithellaceae bacterium]